VESKVDPRAERLRERMGAEAYSRRLRRQREKESRLIHQGEGVFRLERLVPFDACLAFFLKVTGLARRMRREFLDVRVIHREWFLTRLPEAMDGFRLLQLTDLHLDLDPALAGVVRERVMATPHDAAVLTGDYRNGLEGCHRACLEGMTTIADALASARWGVLGNHDSLEMLDDLEAAGIPMLMNEAVEVRRGKASFWLAGIDDPHFHKGHDLGRAAAPIPRGACSILLSHSPETYREAAGHGFELLLGGHTHGGQINLPGGRPLVVPCKVPGRMVSGPWTHGAMQGYTSPGTGACGVAARWNCPPEITLHILRRNMAA
jgi:uncharacterized protein